MARRAFSFGLAPLLLMVMVGMATAGPAKRSRVVEETYATPAVVVPPGDGAFYACVPGNQDESPNYGCVVTRTGAHELYASIEIVDATGLPAAALVFPHDGDEYEIVCGSTPEPLRVSPGTDMEIWFQPATAECPGVATTGTVRITLFRSR